MYKGMLKAAWSVKICNVWNTVATQGHIFVWLLRKSAWFMGVFSYDVPV